MDAELGPATGDFRVWLDLALARGYCVKWMKTVHVDASHFSDDHPPVGDPVYMIYDTQSGAQRVAWDAAGVSDTFIMFDDMRVRTASYRK